MKTRIILLVAACAALAACSKENAATGNISEGTPFKKGQKVTIGVSSASTKVTGTDDGTNINPIWEKGDEVLVTVGGESDTFILASGAGTSTATFEGFMPEDGETFDIQYPVETPDLSTQTYVDGKIPSGKMSFTATGCTLDKTAELTTTSSILQLNLYGVARSVNSIVVYLATMYNKTLPQCYTKYTLNFSAAKVIGENKANATPFYFVVPAGGPYYLYADFNVNELTLSEDKIPQYESYGKGTPFSITSINPFYNVNSKNTFTAGKVLNMPAQCISLFCAPVNCGYDETNYTDGLLYQWGRKYGQGYNTTITPTEMTKADDTEANKDKFGKEYTSPVRNWFSGDVDNTLWLQGSKGNSDPCPDGWRVPTGNELQNIIYLGSTSSDDPKGVYFGTGSNKIFFPVNRSFRLSNGSFWNGGSDSIECLYWSSTFVSQNNTYKYYMDPYCLRFYGSSTFNIFMYVYSTSSGHPDNSDKIGRASGCFVRCVHD